MQIHYLQVEPMLTVAASRVARVKVNESITKFAGIESSMTF